MLADARGVVIRVNPRDIRENPRLSFGRELSWLRRERCVSMAAYLMKSPGRGFTRMERGCSRMGRRIPTEFGIRVNPRSCFL